MSMSLDRNAISTSKMDAAVSTRTLTDFNQTARRHISEDFYLQYEFIASRVLILPRRWWQDISPKH